MKKENPIYLQYGMSMLPVLVNALLEKRAGPRALRAFLKRARTELEHKTQEMVRRRELVNSSTTFRSERLEANRYFEFDRRCRQALRKSLEALECYLKERKDCRLEQALRQYDTSERFRLCKLRTRMELAPLVCERISWAGEVPRSA